MLTELGRRDCKLVQVALGG